MIKMTNSFWREIVDYLPGIFLLFRVDEKGKAHLIFVNRNIRNSLGYTPEEFVLASESAGSTVANGIAKLVEKITVLSQGDDEVHGGDHNHSRKGGRDGRSGGSYSGRSSGNSSRAISNSGRCSGTISGINDNGGASRMCRFHSKRASECMFFFEFRIFSVKTTPHPFIAVSLNPVQDGAAGSEGKTGEVTGHPIFVAESPLMKALMKKVDAVAGQWRYLLFRGESGTGKRTLSRQVLQGEALSGTSSLEWNLPDLSPPGQNETVERLCGEVGSVDETMSKADKLALLIVEIDKLTLSNQNRLFSWMHERARIGKQTRVLATSGMQLEERVQKGKFSAELYYYLGFDTVLLPPLSHRKEDIRYLVDIWLPGAAENLGLSRVEVADHMMEDLLQYDWPGNFHEFFRVMRKSLLLSEQGAFRLTIDSDAVEVRTESAANGINVGLQEVVRFDEMSRRYLEKVLNKTEGKIYGKNGAARLLGMKPTTLQSKLKKLGIR